MAAAPRGDRHGKLRHPATDRCRRHGSGTARREDPARTRRGAPPRAGRGPGQSNRPAEEPRTGDPELDGEDFPLVDLLVEDAGVRRDAEQGLDVHGDEPLDGRRLEQRRLLELAVHELLDRGDEGYARSWTAGGGASPPDDEPGSRASRIRTESASRSGGPRPDRTYSSTPGNPRSRAQRTTHDRETPARASAAPRTGHASDAGRNTMQRVNGTLDLQDPDPGVAPLFAPDSCPAAPLRGMTTNSPDPDPGVAPLFGACLRGACTSLYVHMLPVLPPTLPPGRGAAGVSAATPCVRTTSPPV